MTLYKCGHPVKEVIINTSPESLAIYMEWKDSDSNSCINCWLRERGITHKQICKFDDIDCTGCLYGCIGYCSAPKGVFWHAMKNDISCYMNIRGITHESKI